MDSRPDHCAGRLAAARTGSTEALGELLEPCRPYLLKVAAELLGPKLFSKADAADLVHTGTSTISTPFNSWLTGVHEALLVTDVAVGGSRVAVGVAGLHAALMHTAAMQVSWTIRFIILTYVVPCASKIA